MIEPTGYTALDLIGFTDRGAYDPTATYVKNDIVTVGNTKWRCKVDDTAGITPAENANWTIYLESATSLAGMDDVTLTSPKNGDGLVHDGNDWKNIPIMTKEQWKKNGAYNLLPNEGSTQVSYGLTFTFNPTGYKKGVVHVTGTKSDSGSHGINLSGVFNLKAGTYKILDGLSNNNLGIALIDNSTSTFILQTYNQHEATFTLAADTEVRCTIVFLGAQNTTFDDYIYPMITTDLNATYADYVPHAKTNEQLTEDSYGVVTLDGTKETLAETPSSFVSVPSGTETVVVNYAATSNMTGCFIVTGTVVDGNATGYRRIRMRLARSGKQFYFNVYTAPGMVMSSNYQSTSIALPMRLKAGDNITILATQDSGNSLRFGGVIEFIGKR